MPTPIPFATYRAKLGTLHTAPTPRFPAAWLFLLAAFVLLPLLAFIETALWLVGCASTRPQRARKKKVQPALPGKQR